MNPPPIVLGLILCEKIIVEERTQNISLVSTFTKLFAEDFPSQSSRLALAAVLTGGHGAAGVDLVISHLETDEEIYSMHQQVHFPDRLAEVRWNFHIRECTFPSPGVYDAVLFVDGDPITRRKFSVVGR